MPGAGKPLLPEVRGSTTWSSTLIILGSLGHVVPSKSSGERIVLIAGIEAAVLAHERGGAAADAPAVGGAHVLVAVPAEAHRVRLLVDEDEVLHARGGVAVELDDRHVRR